MTVKNTNRRQELLDVSEQLFYQKGYEKTSMQDICTVSEVTKGALYHYFDSKEEILDAVIKSKMEVSLEKIRCIVNNAGLNALDKVQKIFDLSINAKTTQNSEDNSLQHAIKHQENALYFFKLRDSWLLKITPEVTKVILQGNEETTFNVAYPAETARILIITISDFGDEIERILNHEPESTQNVTIEAKKMAFQNICRCLLVTTGS